MVDCSEKLKSLRKAKGLTQAQAAERLGVTKAMISAYETSAKSPSLEVLLRLSALYGVSIDYLVSVETHKYLDVTGLDDETAALVAALIEKLKQESAGKK